jgi:hypothetical protein
MMFPRALFCARHRIEEEAALPFIPKPTVEIRSPDTPSALLIWVVDRWMDGSRLMRCIDPIDRILWTRIVKSIDPVHAFSFRKNNFKNLRKSQDALFFLKSPCSLF